ncbi:MAG TPA: 50S ribosomal protein L17 [bacterium]
MRHRIDHRKLGMKTAHRLSVLRNLLTALIVYEKINTTVARAKELRRVAEKVISIGKEGSLSARRRAMQLLRSPKAMKKLFDELAKRYQNRNGGYTRLTRIGARNGDGAEISIIELVDRPKIEKKAKPGDKKGAAAETVQKAGVAPKEKSREEKRSWFWWRKKKEEIPQK